ncbi:MAG: hypothetical protein ACYSSO_11190 [Planctomycetota bacterium]|jgi:hypothetical protein
MRLVSNKTLSYLIQLAACLSISIIGYWVPFLVEKKTYEQFHKDIDTRMGMVVTFALPFLLAAAVWSLITFFKLIKEIRHSRSQYAYLLAFMGVVLALPSISAILCIAIKLCIAIAFLL